MVDYAWAPPLGEQRINYDGKTLRLVKADPPVPDGEIPRGEYHQDGELIWAEIYGSHVQIGRIVGTSREDGVHEAAYIQVMKDGTVVAGTLRSIPEILPDGRIRVEDHWARMDGSSGVSYIEEPIPGSSSFGSVPLMEAAHSQSS
ncbi:hypothetical protein [Longispora albida]|uniref:hypothetical protein n=1 Tax=Longispora albida TaxID=203523 RepID=UPI00036EE168|nr:hypothetical protein [Longispora albida]